MLYLDNETCHENPCFHQFSVPNFSGNRNCSVKWADSEILDSSDERWQNISHDKQLFSIQRKLNQTKILMVSELDFVADQVREILPWSSQNSAATIHR